MSPHLRRVDSAASSTQSPNAATPVKALSLLTSYGNVDDDPFDTISAIFPSHNDSANFWWRTTGAAFAQMLKHAFYPVHKQYRYLVFYYLVILPEFGVMPSIAQFHGEDTHKALRSSPITPPLIPSEASTCLPPASLGAQFRSYMTDDHSPIELSWLVDSRGDAVVRFAIDPVRRQLAGDSRGAIGLFEDLGRSNILAKGFNLDWCRICADSLIMPGVPNAHETFKNAPEYPSQYFVGFDFTSVGVVMKAYFLPETRAVVTSTSKSALITSCIITLSTPTRNSPNPPDLLTPWKRVLSFFSSLPSDLAPVLTIVAVDCLPSYQNRVKVYARTARSTLANLRRFLTLGRDPSRTSPATQRALELAEIIWRLLFPALATADCDNVEPPCPQHPTAGLLWYYELRPGHAEPFPKVYLPVRHLCNNDEEVVRVMETVYTKMANLKAADNYGRNVRETFTHRPLSARAGIHTYITLAVKPNDVEVTSYFNPECYAPERGVLG